MQLQILYELITAGMKTLQQLQADFVGGELLSQV